MEDPERPVPVEPPEDAESWTDEQWIAWLEATDDPDVESEQAAEGPHRWRMRIPGSVLGAAMLGLRDAIYGRPRDEIVIVADAGGDPPGDDLPEVHLDLDHPERSEVIIRRDHAAPEPEPPASPPQL